MEKITLDFSNCKYISQIYEEIKIKFGLPQNYGENPDALWDSLRGYSFDLTEITVMGFDNLIEKFDDYAYKIKQVFTYVTEENKNMIFKFIK
jgi:RNAse (barnase) inhibitor barstar